MSTDYSEQIFQSIDTIISLRLNEVSFDKTEICEIISIDEKTIGKYLVSNGSLKYEAYSDDENRKYLIGSKVYVRITNGDYTLRKIITGSYTADEIPKNLYTNPFDHLVVSSKYNWITETNKLSATAYKDETIDLDVYLSKDLTFYYSGLGLFNYIGLEFAATTGFGGTTGEFLIIIDLLDGKGKSLLNEALLGLLTLSSKQLYGNPYYLNGNLKFQHLFNFPVGNFSDLTKVKKVKITLVTKGNFNYVEENDLTVIINDLTIFFGFDSSENEMSKNKVVLVLDNTQSLEYTTANDQKQMSIDWRDLDSGAIYNETSNMLYPEIGKYNIYWLLYSESIGYTKKLEANGGMDIEESGTYWKTVKRQDAAVTDAYTYTLSPSPDWKKEQIKVIIKDIKTNEYVESNGLTFNNTNFRTETGSNKGKPDTLKLTLAEGDDGIYNSYGIDNKLLGTYDLAHSLTVNYVDNTKWDWNPEILKVIWKIPAKATMIRLPGEGWRLEDNFYVYDSNPNLQTIKFNLSYLFSYNKTNNTIYCNIIRYKDKNRDIISDEYLGSITLQFGLLHTAGTGWAFNIVQNQRALSYPSDTMTLTATFENENGEPISLDSWKDKVKWEWYQSSNDSYSLEPKSDNKHQAIIKRPNGGYDPYAIVKATLVGWQNSNGKNVDLEAYLPIAAGHPSYYLTGASRVVYNNTGNAPIYDEEAYGLYNQETHNLVSSDYTYTIMSPEKNLNKVFAINEEEGNLKPLNLLPTQVPKMSLVVKEPSGTIVYALPILVLKNGYLSKLLNEWDGNLKVDPENNKILSALIGAGVKNSDNTFTGVLMGAVGKEMSTAVTGIYGYLSGDLRFKLDEKGNFYVGTGSNNRIDFSGTADGDKTLTIEAKNFKLTTDKLTIDSNNGIKLLDNDGNITIQILRNGTATIGGWSINKLYIQSSDEVVGMSAINTNYAFWAGFKNWNGTTYAKFKVTQDGKLYAEGAEIKGKVELGTGSTINNKDVSEYYTFKATEDSIVGSVNETLKNYATTASLNIVSNNISAKVSKTIKSTDSTESMDWNLNSSSFIVKANGTQVLKVDKNGIIVKGKGTIAGWNITDTYIDTKSGNSRFYLASIGDSSSYILYAQNSSGTRTFSVSDNGVLYATGATITGDITCNTLTANTSGIIAGWTISATEIKKGTTVLSSSTSNGKFTCYNGVIGGWNIGNDGITNGSTGLYSNGNFAFYPSGGAILVGNNALRLKGPSGIAMYNSYTNYSNGTTINKGIEICADGNLNLMQRDGLGGLNIRSYISPSTKGNAADGAIQIQAANNVTIYSHNKNVYILADSGTVYARSSVKTSNSPVKTDAGSTSSRSTKTNINYFTNIDYTEALNLLSQINIASYEYKYKIYEKKKQYGFIIDDIELILGYNKFFDFKNDVAAIKDGYADLGWQDSDDDYSACEKINIKTYNSDVLDKYLLTICKALQQEVERLKQEIKEIKQNEI